MEKGKIHCCDWVDGLRGLGDGVVDCIVTSPPYYGLRDYGVLGQVGLECSPEEFIAGLVLGFREARRVLRDDGVLWVNIGDSYASSGKDRTEAQAMAKTGLGGGLGTQGSILSQINKVGGVYKAKDLIGVPWMLAFALRADGWYLRQDIIWHKPNPMPESVVDRCTKSHEYVFLLSKSPRYYYDQGAIMQDAVIHGVNTSGFSDGGKDEVIRQSGARASWNWCDFDVEKTGEMKRAGRKSGNKARKPGSVRGLPANGVGPDMVSGNVAASVPWEGLKANKRSVWTVTTQAFKEAHFATFPEELIYDMIKAGCRPGGVVLDPFMGAGTTALVARKLGREFIGFELNPEYIKIAEKRLYYNLGLFA